MVHFYCGFSNFAVEIRLPTLFFGVSGLISKAMINIRRICEGISYVGVNDRSIDRFEALWEVPNGVSYNSYLVQGSEKTALIDTVETGYFHNLVAKLRANGGKLDYLVVNHMEPDHSGSIPELIRLFPDVKIIGNKITIGMIGGYYKITDPERFIEVKDGDELSLGDLTLKFILTPMVHWPETMMTYVKERRVLFSGDAFGCFGALNGAVVDCEMNVDLYWREMERYYACIVGKYGVHVQKALGKLKDVELDYICSTHGPVWHDLIDKVVSVYDRMSRYEAEEGVTIVYGSMYGNSASVAETIAMEIAARGVKNIRVHDAARASLGEMLADVFRYKGLVIGSPTYSMTFFPPVAQLLTAIETREVKNRTFAWFSSYTWAPGASNAFKKYFENLKVEPVANMLMKQSAGEEDLAAAAELAEKVVESIKS